MNNDRMGEKDIIPNLYDIVKGQVNDLSLSLSLYRVGLAQSVACPPLAR